MDRVGQSGINFSPSIDRAAEDIEDPSQSGLANRHLNRRTSGVRGYSALQPVRSIHGNGPNNLIAQVALHFENEIFVIFSTYCDGVVNLRKVPWWELAVHHGPLNFNYPTGRFFHT